MVQKRTRRGLGRGLGALIQDTNTSEKSDANRINDDASDSDEIRNDNRVSERYLEDQNVSRETSRPSDIFFGEGGSSSRRGHSTKRIEMPNPIKGFGSSKKDSSPSVASPASKESAPQSDQPDEARYREVQVEDIEPNPRQPRDYFDEDDMRELVASVSEVGVLQPIVVRPLDDNRYQLIMGERRWRASQRAGLTTIPVIVRDTADEDLLREALLENIHRSELNPLEEAAAYEQLMADFGWSQDMLSKRIGRSRPHISNTLRLMNLPASIQPRVASGVLSAGHARALLGLNEQTMMEEIAQRIVNQGLSVRATEELVTLYNSQRSESGRRPVMRRNTAHFEEMASSFGDELDTSVKISLGAKKGKISIDFASVDDLNRIMGLIQPSRRDQG